MANRDIEDILDSDDELPDTYDEIPHIPAYLDDHRFDSSEEDDDANYYIPKNYISPSPSAKLHTTIKDDYIKQEFNKKDYEDKEPGVKQYIKRGVLSKQDIFCLKCVANLATEKTTLWFINFLTQKDMHSKYTFLMSCLAAGVLGEELPVQHETTEDYKMRNSVIDIITA